MRRAHPLIRTIHQKQLTSFLQVITKFSKTNEISSDDPMMLDASLQCSIILSSSMNWFPASSYREFMISSIEYAITVRLFHDSRYNQICEYHGADWSYVFQWGLPYFSTFYSCRCDVALSVNIELRMFHFHHCQVQFPTQLEYQEG